MSKQTTNARIDQRFVETAGEEFFLRYLSQAKLHSRRHVSAGNRNPDFLVKTQHGLVLCEVRDLIETDFDREILKDKVDLFLNSLDSTDEARHSFKAQAHRLQHYRGKSSGDFDPVRRIKKIIDKKRLQIAALRGRIPCVLVLFNRHSFPHDEHMLMQYAINRNRYFGPEFNRGISAVAVIDIERPNKKWLEERLAEKHEELADGRPYGGIEDRDFMISLYPQLETYGQELLSEEEPDFLEREVLKLRIYHNDYAVKPLPSGAFPANLTVEHYPLRHILVH